MLLRRRRRRKINSVPWSILASVNKVVSRQADFATMLGEKLSLFCTSVDLEAESARKLF
jgi:hypothetical protein